MKFARFWRLVLLALVPAALGLAAVLEQRGNPFNECLLVDARLYHETARAMAEGSWRQTDPYWQPPFYVAALAGLYRVFGPNPDAARFVQVLLFMGIALLAFDVTRRATGRERAAWITWGLVAGNGTLLFFTSQLLNAILVTFLLLLAVWFALRVASRGKPWVPLAAGLMNGLAAITVATSAIAAPVLAGWMARARTWRAALLFCVAAALPILCTTAVNLGASGEWIPISYNGGINFWIGNNPDYETTTAIRPGRAWKALTLEPQIAGHTAFAAQSSYFYSKSLAWMAAEPVAALRLGLHKLRLYLRGDEILRNQEIYPYRAGAPLLSATLWIHGLAYPFGLLLPLALGGIALFLLDRQRPPLVWPILLVALALSVVVIVFFVTARYRAPVQPLAAVLAGVFVDAMWPGRPALAQRARFLALATAAAGLVLANTSLPAMPKEWNADAVYDLGAWHQEHGRRAEAKARYAQALELDPSNPEASNNLGALLTEDGRYAEALPMLQRVLQRYPEDANALGNLAGLYFRMNEFYLAGEQYRRAALARPPFPNADRYGELCAQRATALEAEWMAKEPSRFLDLMAASFRQDPANRFLWERLEPLWRSAGRSEAELADLAALRAQATPPRR